MIFQVIIEAYMKRKLVIASHGNFAEGILDAAILISGETDYEAQIFCMQPGESPLEFAIKLETEISTVPEKEFVILIDLFGASIYNALYPLTRFPHVKLFTDFNLHLLIEIMADYKEPLSQSDMETIVTNSRESIQILEYEEAGKAEDF
jgi:mannose/fructose-specific phosphotransferase system component IIA